VGLERGPLSPVCTIEELLESKISSFGLEIREYGLRIRSANHVAPLSANVGSNFANKRTSGGRSVGIVRSRTQATEFFIFFLNTNLFGFCSQSLPYQVARLVIYVGGYFSQFSQGH
jgi:hypothetical protein